MLLWFIIQVNLDSNISGATFPRKTLKCINRIMLHFRLHLSPDNLLNKYDIVFHLSTRELTREPVVY